MKIINILIKFNLILYSDKNILNNNKQKIKI